MISYNNIQTHQICWPNIKTFEEDNKCCFVSLLKMKLKSSSSSSAHSSACLRGKIRVDDSNHTELQKILNLCKSVCHTQIAPLPFFFLLFVLLFFSLHLICLIVLLLSSPSDSHDPPQFHTPSSSLQFLCFTKHQTRFFVKNESQFIH